MKSRLRWSSRLYQTMDGIKLFETNPLIHRYRSTVNSSALWGIRSGTAKHGVGPGSGLFSERAKWNRRRRSSGRHRWLILDYENRAAYYAGRFSRW